MPFVTKKLGNGRTHVTWPAGVFGYAASVDPADTTVAVANSAQYYSFVQPRVITPNSWATAKSGNWTTKGDWSTGTAPTGSNDAKISVAGTYTVTVNSSVAANSLTINDAGATLSETSGGTLSITTTLAVTAGTFLLGAGAEILGGTISLGTGHFLSTGGTLSGVTYQGTLNLSATNAYLTVTNALTLQGTGGTGAGSINLTGSGDVFVADDLTSLNNAAVSIGNTSDIGIFLMQNTEGGSETLTLGSQFNITQSAASGNSVQIQIASYSSEASSETVINQGSIKAATSGGSFSIVGAYGNEIFINKGGIAVSNGDSFTVSNTIFSNSGSISVSGTTSSLELDNLSSNTGTITETGGTLTLGGTLTASNFGTIAVSGGTLSLATTLTTAALKSVKLSGGAQVDINRSAFLDNTGATLTVGTGSALLTVGLAGTISGGTIADAGNGFAFSQGTLSGVTYQGTLNLGAANAYVTVTSGLTLQGTGGTGAGAINFTGSNGVLFANDLTSLNNAAVSIGNTSSTDSLYIENLLGGSETLTLGSQFNITQSATSGAYAQIYIYSYNGQAATETVINQGSIKAASSGGSFSISGAYGNEIFINKGSIAVSNGDSFTVVNNIFSNSGSISVSGTTSSLELDNLSSNTGTITDTGGTLTLGGTLTAGNLGTIAVSGGTLSLATTLTTATLKSVQLSGGAQVDINRSAFLDNTGATLTVGTGSALLTVGLAGTISGGTIADAGNGFAFSQGTLSGVTYQGTLNLGAANAYVTVTSGLTLQGTGGTGAGAINFTGSNGVLFANDLTSLNNAAVSIGNTSSTDSLYIENLLGGSETLTLGSQFNITQSATSGAYAQIYIYSYNGQAATETVINQGSIKAASSGGSFSISGAYGNEIFINKGSIAVSNGDSFTVVNNIFSNSGSISVSGTTSSLELDNLSSNTGTITDTGGTLTLGGTLTAGNLGTIAVSGGTLSLATTLTTATLKSVQLSGGAQVDINRSAFLDNTGATLTVGTGSALLTVGLAGTISGGTIADAGNGFAFSQGTLSGVTYQGTLNLGAANAYVTVTSGLTLQGTGGTGAGAINFTGSNGVLFANDLTSLNNAAVSIGNTSSTDSLYIENLLGGSETLTLGSQFNITQSATSGAYAQIYIYSYNGQAATETVINQGSIKAASSGGSFSISGAYGNEIFINKGSIAVSNGDTFSISNLILGNLAGTTLTGGTFEADANSTLQLTQNSDIVIDASKLILSGTASVIDSTNSTTGITLTLDSTLTKIATTGTLELLSGRAFTAAAGFTDSGLLQLGGASFTAPNLTITAGARLLGTGTEKGALANNGTVEATKGSLVLSSGITGTGTLQVDAGATLELKSITGTAQTAAFNGQGGLLKLDNAAGFAGVIANFAAGDAINLGTLVATAAAASGTSLSITLSGGSILTETLATTAPGEHIGISADGHTLTDYRFAAAAAHTPEPIVFGNHHVGDVASQSLTLVNTAAADGFSESLDALAGATTGGVTDAGSFTGLAAGQSNSTSLSIGLATAVAGAINGTAILNFATDGTGIDGAPSTSIGTQTVNVTGAVYNYAAGHVGNGGTLGLGNVHVGARGAAGALTLANSAAAGAYSEALDATFAIASGNANFSAGGSLTGLAAGNQDASSLTGSFSATQAGAYSTQATLTLASDGINIDGLGITTLTPQTVLLTGAAYNYASAGLTLTVNLGIVHIGGTAQQALALSNTAAAGAYSEALDASFGAATGAATSSGQASLIAAGSTDSADLLLGLNTSASGTQSGTVVLNLASDGTTIDGLGITALSSQTITVTGTVDNYALAAFADAGGPAISGSGTNFAVNLGTVSLGAAALTLSFGALNAATGPADVLGGTLTPAGGTGFTNTGFGTFSGLAAGQAEYAQSISLSTGAAGTFTETIVLTSAGSNASGYNGALANETLTVTGTILPAVYALTTGPNIINGMNGSDVFQAVSGSLNSRDQLTGGNGTNVLQLLGGGIFDIGAPKVFANIPNITALEGQAATGTLASTLQTVYLRDGSNEVLTVTSGNAAAGNTNPEAITIYGGTGADTLTLGTGQDSVILYTGNDLITLGSAANSVTAGGGTATIMSAAPTASAAIIGNTSSVTTLDITTGGTVTLNAADTYLTVNLAAASKLTLGAIGFITANGTAGTDIIIAGAANDTLLGGAKDTLTGFINGGDTFLGTSGALNGDTLGNWTTGDVIDITDMNSSTLKALTFASGKLGVSDGTHTDSLNVKAVGTGTLALGNFTVLGTDGHGGTLIGWHS